MQSADKRKFQVGQQVKIKQGSSPQRYADKFIGKIGTITAIPSTLPEDVAIGYDVRIGGTGFRLGEDWLEEG